MLAPPKHGSAYACVVLLRLCEGGRVLIKRWGRREHKRNAREEVSKEDLVRVYPDPSRLQGLLMANQASQRTRTPSRSMTLALPPRAAVD